MNHPLEILPKTQKKFAKQNAYGLKWESECLFAKQQILKNDYTVSVAKKNISSLESAIYNVAAIGISLNPASAHAYLVPREGAICLDISWRGLVKLATDSGAIDSAKAVLVYKHESEDFVWNGAYEPPLHPIKDPFNTDRVNAEDPLENCVGGYCIAKLSDGSYMCEMMAISEILAIRNTSKAYTSGKNCPWKGKWSGEMAKKTIIKRASKSWPQSNGRDRLDQAIDVINQHEGIELDPPKSFSEYAELSREQIGTLNELLAEGDAGKFYAWYAGLDDTLKIACHHVARPKGEKGKFQKLIESMAESGKSQLVDTASALADLCEQNDFVGMEELLSELSGQELDQVCSFVSHEDEMVLRARYAEAMAA